MGYDCGDSFPFDFELNGNPFGSKLKEKLSPQSYPIHFERKRKYSFLSVEAATFHHKLFIPMNMQNIFAYMHNKLSENDQLMSIDKLHAFSAIMQT